MPQLPKYRIVTTFLVVIFCVFNIGIPVVVAACPMSDQGAGALCGSCFLPAADGRAEYRNAQDRSCCETVLASEGSGAEFLKAASSFLPELDVFCVTLVTPDLNDHSRSSVTVQPADLSGGREDLPVLLSSLLL